MLSLFEEHSRIESAYHHPQVFLEMALKGSFQFGFTLLEATERLNPIDDLIMSCI